MEQNKPATPVAQKAVAPTAGQQALPLQGVTIQAPKAVIDFSAALGDLIAGVKGSLVDGFQIGQDLPVLIAKAIQDLGPLSANAPSLV